MPRKTCMQLKTKLEVQDTVWAVPYDSTVCYAFLTECGVIAYGCKQRSSYCFLNKVICCNEGNLRIKLHSLSLSLSLCRIQPPCWGPARWWSADPASPPPPPPPASTQPQPVAKVRPALWELVCAGRPHDAWINNEESGSSAALGLLFVLGFVL